MLCILYTRGHIHFFLEKGVMSRENLRKLLCVFPLFQNIELLIIHDIDWIILGELSTKQQWLKTELCLSGEMLRVLKIINVTLRDLCTKSTEVWWSGGQVCAVTLGFESYPCLSRTGTWVLPLPMTFAALYPSALVQPSSSRAHISSKVMPDFHTCYRPAACPLTFHCFAFSITPSLLFCWFPAGVSKPIFDQTVTNILDHMKLSETFMPTRDGKAMPKGGIFLLLLSSRSNEPL